MSPSIRSTIIAIATGLTLLATGCTEGQRSVQPDLTPPPAEPATPLASSIDDPRFPDPGESQAGTDSDFLEELNEAIPWTTEISPEILIYAARANCVVQVDTASHIRALADADEQGFHGREGPVFVQLAAQTYCPSMTSLGEPEPTPTPEPEPTPEAADPADVAPQMEGEVVGFQDGTWEVEFEFDEVPGAVAYEFQHRGTDGLIGDSTDWASDVFDAPRPPEESLKTAATVSGLAMTHDPSSMSVNHRVRAYFEDGTVGRWSNVVTAHNPHL